MDEHIATFAFPHIPASQTVLEAPGSNAISALEGIPRDELYAMHASFCQALSDPKRLLIVSALRGGERSVRELCQLVGARQSNVSQHLALMRHLGLVES